MKRFAVLIPAAGRSTRFGGRVAKPFLTLGNALVWRHAVGLFAARADVEQVVLIVSPEILADFRAAHGLELEFTYGNVTIVSGGPERFESVALGLQAVDAATEFVAVHDCARPLTPQSVIDRVFTKAIETGAAIAALPLADTVKRLTPEQTIESTVPREHLWGAQTPQAFRHDWLRAAYAAPTAHPTDDAQLVEATGQTIHVVPGDPRGLKITTPADLALAGLYLQAAEQRPVTRRPADDEED